MVAHAIADAGFIVALLSARDAHHHWAVTQTQTYGPPWHTCEAVLSESFHLLGPRGAPALSALLERQALFIAFTLESNLNPVLGLLRKYAGIPMSLADACLVRMSETLPEPVVLTTDSDFRIYRRHSRQVVPCVLPG